MEADHAANVAAGQVFVTGDPVIGLVVLEEHADHLFLDSIAVHPDAHGGGVGRRLLGFVDARARALGLPEIRLYTNAMMWENQKIYPRFGYEVVERRVDRSRTTASTTASGWADPWARSAVRPPGACDVLADLGALGGTLVGLLADPAGVRLPQGLLHGRPAHGCLLRGLPGSRVLTEVDPFRESASSRPRLSVAAVTIRLSVAGVTLGRMTDDITVTGRMPCGADWDARAATFDEEPDHGLRDPRGARGLGRPAAALAARAARRRPRPRLRHRQPVAPRRRAGTPRHRRRPVPGHGRPGAREARRA